MRLYEPITLIIVVVTVAALAAGGYASWRYFGMPQDNMVEEVCEDGINDLTGVEPDLSPETPEQSISQIQHGQ